MNDKRLIDWLTVYLLFYWLITYWQTEWLLTGLVTIQKEGLEWSNIFSIVYFLFRFVSGLPRQISMMIPGNTCVSPGKTLKEKGNSTKMAKSPDS